jgi:hypothetical protein
MGDLCKMRFEAGWDARGEVLGLILAFAAVYLKDW